jgi:hypothetical protein
MSFSADIEAMERATVEAVAPDRLDEIPGWLLPMDGGTIGRARSAVPLTHDVSERVMAAQLAQLPDIVARYRAYGMAPAFRLPQSAAHLHAALAQWGAVAEDHSWVMTASPQGIQDAVASVRGAVGEPADNGLTVQVATEPSPEWAHLFLGEGFDPVDGANRVRNLSRAPCTLYLTAWRKGQALACGAASIGYGWLGVHGMRTAQGQRGQGLATRVLQTMAREALSRGVDRIFLQVGGTNAGAQSVYLKAGFAFAWQYAYWKLTVL